jgi:hypothetical protein
MILILYVNLSFKDTGYNRPENQFLAEVIQIENEVAKLPE